MTSNRHHIGGIRRDYGTLSLNEVEKSPFMQFSLWLNEILKVQADDDPTAMVLSTVDEQGYPDSRVVLLKGLENNKFVFFTNYHSTKAQQISFNPKVALNFYWSGMSRQVRIRGNIQKIADERSDIYFSARPSNSQISAIISEQSKVIPSREFLEKKMSSVKMPCDRPQYWGGYEVIPLQFEFWQGRNDRLHDRIRYLYKESNWLIERLSP